MKKKLIVILVVLAILLIAVIHNVWYKQNVHLADNGTATSGGLTSTVAVPTSPPSISTPPGSPPR